MSMKIKEKFEEKKAYREIMSLQNESRFKIREEL